jgi:hypothetical protein
MSIIVISKFEELGKPTQTIIEEQSHEIYEQVDVEVEGGKPHVDFAKAFF